MFTIRSTTVYYTAAHLLMLNGATYATTTRHSAWHPKMMETGVMVVKMLRQP